MIKTLLSNAPRMVEISLLLLAAWWASTLLQPNDETSPSPTSMIPSNTEKTSLVSLKSAIMNRGFPPGMGGNQGLPPGMQAHQGFPPGMQINQDLPPGMIMNQGFPPNQ